MHMADALVVPAVAATMYVCSAAVTGVSLKKVNIENDIKKIPTMGVMGAFVFAAQMINFTIPGTGSSGHICGGMLLSAILGPYAGFLTMIGILFIQCLLFADGGLMALGCNIWNMAFYSCFVGGFLIWKSFMKTGITKKKIAIASIVGSVVSLQMGAFSVVLETTLSGVTSLPFGVFAATMQPIHLAIGVVEGVVTALVLVFLYDTKPELLYSANRKTSRISYKKVLCILAVVTALTAGIFSLLASAFPDGLEWSMEKVSGVEELQAETVVHQLFEKIQEDTSILPDYSFANSDSVLGTSFSGIVGAFVVFLLCFFLCKFLVYRKKKKECIHE